ncbi:threonine/serine exporter family protein [Phosphitispora fastidiosa]|uniref:threonine/serine exporter family protein n=1 Tax=Phosphitispora fastidiosa TaxID=2837202 RepID=UPI001E50524D|nr:threonine/serine exporter family protein [Phosphitispora fastidiosa]MBU7005571.1 uncharacterized membrane protein YjjB (DUF3815 family) [Phosphitispora fastidiosa]
MLIKMFLAFLTTLFTGITLQTPKSALVTAGLTGMLGWTVYNILIQLKFSTLFASVSGAIIIGGFAEIMSRIQKQPVTVYIVSGIIPLVPGITSYDSMLDFINSRYIEGIALAFKALLIAAYLATGLAIVPITVRFFRRRVGRFGEK